MTAYLLLLLIAGVMCTCIALWLDVAALRRLAAWSLARALYIEMLRAERLRLRGLAADFEAARLREYGVGEEVEL